MKYHLIEANEEFLVINKPSGLLVHGAPHIKDQPETLANQLLADYPEIARVGEDPDRPGLMHRLDMLVSGLMVVARTQASFDHLKSQFKSRTVTKLYTALVYGSVDADEGEIDFLIQRSSKGHKMAALPKTVKGETNPLGRRAITEFCVRRHFINYTLLEIKIRTGRTHQIRTHLSAYGYPVVGDDLYGTKKTRIKNKKLELGRIFLVAHHLEFDDLDGKRRSYTIDLPDELTDFLNKLK